MKKSALEEGDPCPFRDEGCSGHMMLPHGENCSCHISPPCGSCLDVVLTCDECGYEDEDEH